MQFEKKDLKIFFYSGFCVFLISLSGCGIKGKPLPPIAQPFVAPATPAQQSESETQAPPSNPVGKKKVSK